MARPPISPALTANVIQRVDCDPATGLPRGELKIFVDTRRSEGWVDGSVVDADGVLWNARWGGGARRRLCRRTAS